VGLPLQHVEVGLFPGMVCMAPQLYVAEGNRSYLGVFGRNGWPMVPVVNYPNKAPRPQVFRESGGAELWGLASRHSPQAHELANGLRLSTEVSC
jgi:hypothetical protein